MSKIIKVACCGNCPFLQFTNNGFIYCSKPRMSVSESRILNEIELNEIPDWCPLEDDKNV